MTISGFNGVQLGALNERGGSIRGALRERPGQVIFTTLVCVVLGVMGIGMLVAAGRYLVTLPEILGGLPAEDQMQSAPVTILRIFTAGLVSFGLIFLGTAIFMLRRFVKRWFASQRMAKFAQENGFAYQGDLPGPRFQAVVMKINADDIDHHRVVTGQVDGRRIEFGDFEATRDSSDAGDSNTRTTEVLARYAYIAIDLGVRAPHFVLDSVSNKRLFRGYGSLKRWDLEGDFPEHFTTWVEEGNEPAMLELMTPDFMHEFSEYGQEFDYEIQGTLLLIIANRRSIGNAHVAEGMLRVADRIVPGIRQKAMRGNW
ncbi:hypothetical protein [Gulosibacter molinativorax]|uniref:DUF3137 domain-containing protein n=1 Tax=Gulosibacter molinativorax TaxID=256821 RepID=A0ABT7C7I2_9MICO|nr:hypothetical protein [Gulosibacter molinativorax]MDJ1371102.1 hypothetical protein [Gulosibacter molinativorax]QUY61462.1 Hypotetical protein [Gulosibacter molinativorax]